MDNKGPGVRETSLLSIGSKDLVSGRYSQNEPKWLRKLYALLDGLESTWPTVIVYFGAVIELVQISSLLFTKAYAWGPLIQLLSYALQSTILPLWSSAYLLTVTYAVNIVFVLLTGIGIGVLYFFLFLEYRKIDIRCHLRYPSFTKVLLYLLIGPFFLPCLQLLLAFCVCTGAHGTTKTNYLSAFYGEVCLGENNSSEIAMFVISLALIVLLFIPKLIISCAVFEDNPLSENVRARSHSMVEVAHVVYLSIISVLGHYLPSIGQIETFAALFAAFSFAMAALHVVFIPFYDDAMNRIRVIGFSVLFFSGLLMVIELALGSSSPIYGNNNLDIAVLLPGALVIAIITHGLTHFRVSSQFRRDVARARHGEIHAEKFKRRMFFPYYLPIAETRWFHINGYVLDARNNVVVRNTGGIASLRQTLSSIGASTMTSPKGSSHVTESTFLGNASGTSVAHREIDEMNKFEMTCYLDSVYFTTDVELSSRFLIGFYRVTETTIPDHLLEYGIGIYNKGLNRFVRDAWLQLQFAIFLCTYYAKNNHVSVAFCEDLQNRQLGPILAYRLHRLTNIVSDQRIRRTQAARHYFQQAFRIHKETIVQMQLFWKRMASERIDLSTLAQTSLTIIGGCQRGGRYYRMALEHKPDPTIVTRYAQFVEDVLLDAEAADYAREIAADMTFRREEDIVQKDVRKDGILVSQKKLGRRYGRISRNLRLFLIVMFLFMFLILVGVSCVIGYTYQNGSQAMSALFTASEFRYSVFRTMWLAGLAQGVADTSSIWNVLEDSVTELRRVFAELTYGEYSDIMKNYQHISNDNALKILYKAHEYPIGSAGFWRAAEILINALESLILYRTSPLSRETSNELISENNFYGIVEVFNSSLNGLQEEASTLLRGSLEAIIGLYVVALFCGFFTFFVFRYYLARVTGIVMMALNLFCLIPRNALETIAKDLGDKLEHFEDPDAGVERKVRERQERSYQGKYGDVDGSSPVGMGVGGRSDRSFDTSGGGEGGGGSGGALLPGVRTNSSGDRFGGNSPPNTAGAFFMAGDTHPSGTNGVLARGGSQESSERSPFGHGMTSGIGGTTGGGGLMATSGMGGGGLSTPISSHPWKAGMEDGQGGGGSKFDLLARNSSVADVGRLKMHMGQYEAPYQKGFFAPRKFSEAEAKAREDHINEVELESNLATIRAQKEAVGGGGSSGTTAEQLEEATGYTPPATLDSSKSVLHHRVTLGLTILVLLLAVSLGTINFLVLEKLVDEGTGGILILRDVNLFEQKMLQYLSQLETFSFLAAKSLGTTTTDNFYSLTTNSLSGILGNASAFTEARFSLLDDFSLLGPNAALGKFQYFDYYSNLLLSQLLAAGRLACNSFIPPTNGRMLDCSFFSTVYYTESLFRPNQTESALFDMLLDLPTTWEIDSQLGLDAQAQLAVNVMLSPYYLFVYNQTKESWHQVRQEVLTYLMNSTSSGKNAPENEMKTIAFIFAVLLTAVVLGVCLQTGMHGTNSFSFIGLLISSGFAIAALVFQTILFISPLPFDGPLEASVAVLADMSDIYSLLIQAAENAKQSACANNWNGVVMFATVTAPNLFSSWNDLFERAGSEYFAMLTQAYSDFQTSFYLLTIALRLAISYQGMPDAFTDLSVIVNCNWDLDKETYGDRLQQMYDGTAQMLYSTKAQDLALPTDEQKDLAYSLITGPWVATDLENGRTSINSVMYGFLSSQTDIVKERYRLHYPLLITAGVLAFVIAFIGLVVNVFIGIFLLQVRHSRKNLGHQHVRNIQHYDRGFSSVVRWSSFLMSLFMLFLSVLTVILAVHYMDMTTGFRHVNVLNLREVQLFKSDMAISKSIKEPRFITSAMYFAEQAIHSAMEYNRVVHLSFFSDIPRLLFGGVDNITNLRYSKAYALDSSLTPFEDQSPVLAFENYVDPSMCNWKQRVLEISTMSATNLEVQQAAIRTALFNLTEYSFNSTEAVYKDLQGLQAKWLTGQILVLLFSFAMLFISMLYMVFHVVANLREKEEGMQVVLQMIPRSIREAIPAISHYMGTGRMAVDNNALEIEQLSKDLSVIPIVTINTQGKIRQFSRAAEESFLWTRGEAVGQSVNILMPDNIAEEHDRYLQNYLKTGIKYMIGNNRPIRAKRKDGTLFSALIEVMEYHNGTELLFVSAIHVSQESLELEKSCELSQSLTDASIIPIVVIDSDGVIQLFSKGAEEAFKTTAEDMIGQKVNMLMPRQEAELHDSYLERYFRNKTGSFISKPRFFRGKRMNGEIFPIRLVIKELQIAGRTFFVGYIEDLTARLRLEMVAAAGEVMQAESPVPMVVTDMEGRIRQCSKSILQLCGVPPAELLQRPIRSLVRNENVLDLVEKVKNNPRGYQTQTFDFHVDECPVIRINEEGVEETFQARVVSRLFQWHTKGMHLMLFIEDLTTIQTLDLNCRVGSAVMGMSTVPIVVVREDGAIKQMSAAAEQAFHCFASDMYHKKIDLLFAASEGMELNEASTSGSRSVMSKSGSGDENEEEDSLHAMFSFSSVRNLRSTGQKNPVAQVLGEYQKSGSLGLCGRKLQGVAVTADYGTPFPVEVIVVKVGEEYGDEALFLVYIRNTEDDHRLLEVTRWNDAYMGIAPVATVCATLDGKIFACSDSTCEHFGWKKEELIGENVTVLMPSHIAADHDRHLQQFREVLRTSFKEGPRKSMLNRRTVSVGCTKNGKEFPVTIMLRDVHIEGADSFLIASIRPSHQDVALESLGKVSSTMSALSPCPFIAINADGIVSEFSRSAQETFGYSELEVVGQNIKMLQTPDVAAMHDGYLRSYEKTGVKHVLDQETSVIARKKDGSLLNISLTVKEIRSEHSLEFVGFLRDVTIKKTGKQIHAMDALIELEAASPMVEIDGYGNIKNVRYLEAEFGYSAEDLVGKNVVELLPEPVGGMTNAAALAKRGPVMGAAGKGAPTTGMLTPAMEVGGRSTRSWVEDAVEELLELQPGVTPKARGRGAGSMATGGGAPGGGPGTGPVFVGGTGRRGETQWVSRRLMANRKKAKKLWCEVVLGELIQPEDPLAAVIAAVGKEGGRRTIDGHLPYGTSHSDSVEKGKTAVRRENKRILVYLRNLEQEVKLELYEGINYTATDLYPIPLLTMNLEGRITLFNRAAEETLAYLAKDTIGELFSSFLFQSEHKRFEEALEGLRKVAAQKYPNGEKVLQELTVRRKGSSGPLRMAANLRIVKDSGKDTEPYILATLRDTSNEIAVSTEEALSNVLMSYSIIPSILTDHTGKIESFSSGAEQLFGYSKIEVEGRNVSVIPCYIQSLKDRLTLTSGETEGKSGGGLSGKDAPMDFLRTRMTFTNTTTHPVALEEHVVVVKKNGEKLMSVVHVHSIMPYKKKLPLFIAYFQDQKTVELQERPLQLMMNLMESSLSGVLVIAAHGVVLRGNKTAWSLLGYEKEELINLPVSAIMPVEKPGSSALLLAIRYVMKTTEEKKFATAVQKEVMDGELVGKDGRSTEVHAVVSSVLPSSGGEHMRVVINFIHIAGKRKAKVFQDREIFLDEISGSMVFEIDVRHEKFIHVSNSFLKALECSKASDILDHTWESFVPNGDKRLQKYITKVVESSEKGRERYRADDAQLTFVGSSGKSVKMEGKIRSIERRNGTVCSLLGSFHSVSLSTNQLSQLAMTAVTQSQSGMVLCTVDGTILSANEKVYELFSLPPTTPLIGTRLSSLFPSESQETMLNRFERLLGENKGQVVRAFRCPHIHDSEDKLYGLGGLSELQKKEKELAGGGGKGGELSSAAEMGKGLAGVPSVLRLIVPGISEEEWNEKRKGSTESDRTMMVEIRLESIRGDSGGNVVVSSTGAQRSVGGRGSARSSEPSSTGILEPRSQGQQSSLILVRMREADRQHQEALLSAAMKVLLATQECGSFTIDASGIIRSWGPRAHQLLYTPNPIGANICDVVLTTSSGASFRELLEEYRRNRTLAVLQRVILTANCYAPPPPSLSGGKESTEGKWSFFGSTPESEEEADPTLNGLPALPTSNFNTTPYTKVRKGGAPGGGPTLMDGLSKKAIGADRKAFVPKVIATARIELTCKEAKREGGSLLFTDLLCYMRKLGQDEAKRGVDFI